MTVMVGTTEPVGRTVREAGRAELEGRRAVRSMLSTVERVIFGGDGQAVARANAWAAVQEDRERARLRAAASAALARGEAAVTVGAVTAVRKH